ncbi:hypothetical protein KCM76_02250 [Zooshikella marina]|uniref:hypothetical protein n=1 Tax=Zooshikella ganghwensis TaxID=202772 RepID=UPI001BAF6FAF|nr:hypothetical protein [Zooshikella ganghwensis]MBU2704783.1 hypothetical protein [Zooshikella ganghwensis]
MGKATCLTQTPVHSVRKPLAMLVAESHDLIFSHLHNQLVITMRLNDPSAQAVSIVPAGISTRIGKKQIKTMVESAYFSSERGIGQGKVLF